MPSTTSKLNLTLPYESEYYDISVQNGNFQKIDDLTHITKSGTATATRYAINSATVKDGTVTWYYQIFDDGIIQAWTTFQTNALCNDSQKQDGTWRSGFLHINYPSLGQAKIINRAIFAGSGDSTAAQNWAADVSTYGSSTGYQSFRLISMVKETTKINKNIYMSFVATTTA